MKNLKIFTLSLLLIVISSCEFDDTNVDPSQPEDVALSALLPSLETGMSFALGGEGTLFANIMTQHVKGGSTAQQGQFTKYNIAAQDMDGYWQNVYTNVLNIAHLIIEKAGKQDSPYYSGIAKILMAYGIATMTDTFGDVPYSTAFRSDKNIIPTYDSQEKLYESIQKLLDEAITDLANKKSFFSPGSDDLIYKGSTKKWSLAAKSLKAKFHLHLSKVDVNAYTKALDAIKAGVITSEAGNLQQVFGQGGDNPRYSFNDNRSGNILPGDYFRLLLTNNKDPRYKSHIKEIKDKKGKITGYSNASTFYTSQTSPVPYVTFAELKLIEAEALLKTGGADADVKVALLAGADANIQTVTGKSDATYQTALGTKYDNATTEQDKLKIIIEEKYVVTYSTGVESWNDYRRTGFPILTPDKEGDRSTNPGGAIPRRLPYPDNEEELNKNIPFVGANMQKRFWWDKK